MLRGPGDGLPPALRPATRARVTTLMPFQTSKMKLARARYHAGAFRARLDTGDAEASGAALRSFVRELRAALDSTIVDIARVRSKEPEDAHFPFAENAETLSDLIDVEIRRIDEELAEHLKGLRLYRGGSRLYLLHELGRDGTRAGATAPVMDELLRTVTETIAELGTRFWARP